MDADYKRLADDVARQIAAGIIPIGARLPPQRDFAFQRGIATSTASRVYSELRKRGLIVGETGRGTFVRHRFQPIESSLLEPGNASIDLEMVSPADPRHQKLVDEALRACLQGDGARRLLAMSTARGTPGDREVVAEFLSTPDWDITPDTLLFAGNGKQAIAATLSAVAGPGQRVGVEALTYPFVKSFAQALGLELVPIAMDDEGMIPDDLDRTIRAKGLTAIYVQPTLQSPLVTTMGTRRRHAIADALRRHDIVAIEDGIYSFLADETPLAAICPAQVIHIDSMSKRVMPAFTIAVIIAPGRLVEKLGNALRAGAWNAPNISLGTSVQLMRSGSVQEIVASKRLLATKNCQLARRTLDRVHFKTDPRAFHGWLPLPPDWRSDAFVEAVARQGIAVAPGSAFAVQPGQAPQGVRLALSTHDPRILRYALETLQSIIIDRDL